MENDQREITATETLYERMHAWVCSFQRERIESTYEDYDDPELKEFFFDSMYPRYEDRPRMERRNRAFEKLTRNTIARVVIGGTITGLMEKMVELHDLSNTMDGLVARHLAEKCATAKAELECQKPDAYREAFVATSTYKERISQLELAQDCFRRLIAIAKNPKFRNMEYIIKRVPRFLIRSAELLRFGLGGYQLVIHRVGEIEEIYRILSEREKRHLQELFSKPEQKASTSV